MTLLLLLRSNPSYAPSFVATRSNSPGRSRRLPGTFWTIDDHPVDVGGDWSASETANFGFDQFRGQITPRSAHALPWTVGTGSIVRGVTDDGVVIWEGSVSAPLTIEANEWVTVAAQGYAHQAAKVADRFPVLVTSPEAWAIANASPFNFPQVASSQPSVETTSSAVFSEGNPIVPNTVSLDLTNAEDVSIVFWARGSRLSRFSAIFNRGGTALSAIYGAVGPDLVSSIRPIQGIDVDTSVGGIIDAVIPLANAFDAIVVRWKFATAATTTITMKRPMIWAERRDNLIRAREVARSIGDHLGWDVAGVEEVGDAVFPAFDWGGTAIGAITEAAGPDDLVWQVREDAGLGPRLDLREWGAREWVVSAKTGATWNLDRMEPYERVTAQYLDASGQVRTTTVDVDTIRDVVGRPIKEALVTLGGTIPVDTTSNTPDVLAAKILRALSPQRWRGDITAGQVYLDGRNAPYEVRAGDNVRISDYSKLDGALVDRIASVTRNAGGVVISLEPTEIAGGGRLQGKGGAAPGTLIAPTHFYIPPAGAGGSTPTTGVNPPYNPNVPDILF